MLTDKQPKNGQTNGRNNTNLKQNLAMMVMYVPVKFEFDWTKRWSLMNNQEDMHQVEPSQIAEKNNSVLY